MDANFLSRLLSANSPNEDGRKEGLQFPLPPSLDEATDLPAPPAPPQESFLSQVNPKDYNELPDNMSVYDKLAQLYKNKGPSRDEQVAKAMGAGKDEEVNKPSEAPVSKLTPEEHKQNRIAGSIGAAKEFIGKQEGGLHLQPYDDGAGNMTIGYGHKIRPGEDFSKGITEDEASALYAKDAGDAARAVERYSADKNLNPQQRAALTSFIYNLGEGNFRNSTLRRDLEAGNLDPNKIAEDFAMYNRVNGQISEGLTKRRAEEAALFNGQEMAAPVPTQLASKTPSGAITEESPEALDKLPAPPRAPASEPSAPQSFVPTEGTKSNLMRVQDAIRNAQQSNLFNKSAGQIGYLIASGGSMNMPEDMAKNYDQSSALEEARLEDLKTRIAAESKDPMSRSSQASRATLQTLLGPDKYNELNKAYDFNTMSAEDMSKNLPLLERFFATKEKTQALQANQNKKTELSRERLDTAASDKLQVRYNKEVKPFEDSFRASDKVSRLLDEIESGKVVPDKAMLQTLSQDIAQMAAVGNSSAGLSAKERKEYKVATIQSDANALLTYFTGVVNGTQNLDSSQIKQFKAKTRALRENAMKGMTDRYTALRESTPNDTAKSVLDKTFNTRMDTIKDSDATSSIAPGETSLTSQSSPTAIKPHEVPSTHTKMRDPSGKLNAVPNGLVESKKALGWKVE